MRDTHLYKQGEIEDQKWIRSHEKEQGSGCVLGTREGDVVMASEPSGIPGSRYPQSFP